MGTGASTSEDAVRRAITSHPREFETNRYVYPVLSRRSRGISVGVNLNPDKICNFDCIYCQVDRAVPARYRTVDMDLLEAELKTLLEDIQSGLLFRHPAFAGVPDALRRINDIAFSGDGEPTTCPGFRDAVERAAALKRSLGLDDVKLVVITNCTRFHRPEVLEALELLHRNNGEIWAKLDAGTSAYYDLVERTRVSFDTVVRNIEAAASRWPLVIQSLFMRIRNVPPPPGEIRAFCDLLRGILDRGGRLKLIQVYTVARRPAEDYVTPLSNDEIDTLAAAVREHLPGVPVEVYYGATSES